MAKQGPARKTYTMKALMRTLGISRSTLRYYESIGIIDPERDPISDYRLYTDEDFYRFIACDIMHNTGYEVQEARDLLREGPDARRFAELCLVKNRERLVLHNAMDRALNALTRVIDGIADPWPELVMADSWLMYLDGCERGFDNLSLDEAHEITIRSMPATSFGGLIEGDPLGPEQTTRRWGRMVSPELVELMPELVQSHVRALKLGGCPCVRMPYRVFTSEAPQRGLLDLVRDRLRNCLGSNGLRFCGQAFMANSFPVDGSFYCELYVPVKAVSLRGRRLLRKLSRSKGHRPLPV